MAKRCGLNLTAGWAFDKSAHIHDPTIATKGYGVAVLTRPQFSVVEFPQDFPTARAGRWQHVAIAVGRGHQLLHLFNVYGFSGAAANRQLDKVNTAMIEDVTSVLASLGQVPSVLCGDFNDNIHAKLHLRTILNGLINCGTDRPTYAKNWEVDTDKSCIDHLLVNPTAQAAILNFEYRDDLRFGQHTPLSLTLNLCAFRASFQKWIKSPSLCPDRPKDLWSRPDHEDLVANLRLQAAPHLQDALAQGQSEAFLSVWGRMATAYLSAGTASSKIEVDFTADPLKGPPTFGTFKVSAPTSHAEAGALDASVIRDSHIASLAARLVQTWAGMASATYSPFQKEVARTAALKAWEKLSKKFSVNISTLEEARTFLATARKKVVSSIQKLRRYRQRNFRQLLNEDVELRHRLLKAKTADIPAVMKLPDGSFTADFTAKHQALLAAWRPLLARYDVNPKPVLEDFLTFFASEIQGAHLQHQCAPITGRDLYQSVNRRKRKAKGGLDSWETTELQCLPIEFFDDIAVLFNEIEAGSQQWPPSVLLELCSLIPKSGVEVGDIANMRPITLMSVLYHAWAAARFKSCRTWAETITDASLFGGRANSSCPHAEWPAALEIERAHMSGSLALKMIGLTADRRKCFDLFDAPFCCDLHKKLGADHGVFNALKATYQNQIRYFKLGQSVGPPLAVTGSTRQGCSFSVQLVNGTFNILAIASRLRLPLVSVQFFIDDMKARVASGHAEQLRAFVELNEVFNALTGQIFNLAKSHVWGTDTATRKLARSVWLSVSCLHILPSLGYVVNTLPVVRRGPQDARCAAAHGVVKSVSTWTTTLEIKAAHITSNAIPKMLYGTDTVGPTKGVLAKLETAVLWALFGHGVHQRCRNLAMICVVPIKASPLCAMILHAFITARRMMRRLPHLKEPFLEMWFSNTRSGPAFHLRSLALKLMWELDENWNFERFGDVPLHFHNGSDECFAHELRRSVRFYWTTAIPARKDTAGVEATHVDLAATQVLLRSRCSREFSRVRHESLLFFKGSLSSYEKGVGRSILAASIPTNDRLQWTDDRDLACLCGVAIETLDHVFFHCPMYNKIFAELPLEKAGTESVDLCAIVREPSASFEYRQFAEQLSQTLIVPPPFLGSNHLDIYTDGACLFQSISALRRAGCGLYVPGADHLSDKWPLPGLDQSSIRAEIAAALRVLCVFQCPVRLVVDCEAVETCVKALMVSPARSLGNWAHADLWSNCATALAARVNAFQIFRVPSHLDPDEFVSRGFSLVDWEGNSGADERASDAAKSQFRPGEIDAYFAIVRTQAERHARMIRIVKARNDAYSRAKQSQARVHDAEQVAAPNALVMSVDISDLEVVSLPPLFFTNPKVQWDYSSEYLTGLYHYFNGLAWNMDQQCASLELALDIEAFVGSTIAKRERIASTASSKVITTMSAIRTLERLTGFDCTRGGKITTSCLTMHGLPRSVGFNARPVWRRPEALLSALNESGRHSLPGWDWVPSVIHQPAFHNRPPASCHISCWKYTLEVRICHVQLNAEQILWSALSELEVLIRSSARHSWCLVSPLLNADWHRDPRAFHPSAMMRSRFISTAVSVSGYQCRCCNVLIPLNEALSCPADLATLCLSWTLPKLSRIARFT